MFAGGLEAIAGRAGTGDDGVAGAIAGSAGTGGRFSTRGVGRSKHAFTYANNLAKSSGSAGALGAAGAVGGLARGLGWALAVLAAGRGLAGDFATSSRVSAPAATSVSSVAGAALGVAVAVAFVGSFFAGTYAVAGKSASFAEGGGRYSFPRDTTVSNLRPRARRSLKERTSVRAIRSWYLGCKFWYAIFTCRRVDGAGRMWSKRRRNLIIYSEMGSSTP